VESTASVASHQPYPWALLLAVPGTAALLTVGVRLMLEAGYWQGLPLFAALLIVATVAAAVLSWWLAGRQPRARRIAAALGLFAGQMVLVSVVVAGLWEVLPFGYAGP